MKTKKFQKKLSFRKTTVANLGRNEMIMVAGGGTLECITEASWHSCEACPASEEACSESCTFAICP